MAAPPPLVEACALALGESQRWLCEGEGGVLAAPSGVLRRGGVLFLQRLAAGAGAPCVLFTSGGAAVHVQEDGALTTRAQPAPRSTQFSLVPLPGGALALRSEANELFVSADAAGRVTAASVLPAAVALCHGPVVGMLSRAWALGSMHNARVALLTYGAHGWVTARPPMQAPGALGALTALAGVASTLATLAGGCAVSARTQRFMNWEQFRLYVCDAAAGSVALEAVDHRLWLCPFPDGRVRASAAEVGGWERLALEDAGDGTFALRTCHGGAGARYISAQAEDGSVDANAINFASARERFYLVDAAVGAATYGDVDVRDAVAGLQGVPPVLAQRIAARAGGGGGGGGGAHAAEGDPERAAASEPCAPAAPGGPAAAC